MVNFGFAIILTEGFIASCTVSIVLFSLVFCRERTQFLIERFVMIMFLIVVVPGLCIGFGFILAGEFIR